MIFCRKIFVSHYRGIFLGNTFVLQNISGIEVFYATKGGGGRYHVSPSSFFFVSQCPKNLLQNTSELQKFLGMKLFCSSEWGVSRFSVELFCLTVLKHSLGNTSLLQKYSVIEGFFASEGGGGVVSRFSVEIFCLTVPKNFFREHFGASEVFGYRRVLRIKEWGRVITFLRRNFFSHNAEKFLSRTLRCVKKLQGLETFLHKKLVSQFYFKIFLSPCRISSMGSRFVFQKFFVEDFNAYEGERSRGLSKKFCPTVPKIFVGIRSRIQQI